MRPRVTDLFIVVSLILGCFAFALEAQTRPDLNGIWKMNPTKSNFGPRPTPQSIIVRFQQEGLILRETLTVVDSDDTSTLNFSYTMDGKESINLLDGQQVKSIASWDSDTLVIEWKDKGGTFRRRFAFSENGKVMRVEMRDSTPEGETNNLVVLERQ
jgi:hypothetical protein